jgi:hypothetical protein
VLEPGLLTSWPEIGVGFEWDWVFVRLAWKNDGRGNLFFQYFNILLVKKKKNYYVARV